MVRYGSGEIGIDLSNYTLLAAGDIVMRVIFSITNGLVFLLAFSYLLFTTNQMWNYGLQSRSLDTFAFGAIFSILFMLNIRGFWQFPGVFLSLLQMFLNLFSIPFIYVLYITAVTYVTVLFATLDPNADLAGLRYYTYMVHFIAINSFLSALFIAFNLYKYRKASHQ